MAGHTPRPWSSPDFHRGMICAGPENGPYNGMIARVDCGDYARSVDEGIANTRLIASAPDLLEALKLLLSSAHDFQSGISEAQEAIAKATGQS